MLSGAATADWMDCEFTTAAMAEVKTEMQTAACAVAARGSVAAGTGPPPGGDAVATPRCVHQPRTRVEEAAGIGTLLLLSGRLAATKKARTRCASIRSR